MRRMRPAYLPGLLARTPPTLWPSLQNRESMKATDATTRKAQDQSWEDGYFSGRDGDARQAPAGVSWPSHWYVGFDAAVADKAGRSARRDARVTSASPTARPKA